LLAAARRNAQHSTGPRSAAAMQNSKLNAMKHGRYALPENHRQAMLALGEDPEERRVMRVAYYSAALPNGLPCRQEARVIIALDQRMRP
jgi:hypothetical protein